MHWPRLQVFMRFLVNYSYGVCVLGRVRLAACAGGKSSLASRSASPKWGSIPREETGTEALSPVISGDGDAAPGCSWVAREEQRARLGVPLGFRNHQTLLFCFGLGFVVVVLGSIFNFEMFFPAKPGLIWGFFTPSLHLGHFNTLNW